MRRNFFCPICICITLLLSFSLLSCGGKGETKETDIGGETANGHQEEGLKESVLLIIAQNDFQDKEYSTVRSLLEEKGYSVKVATSQRGTAVGVMGLVVTPDLMLSEVKVDDYAGVIFIGGSGAESLFGSDLAHQIASEAVQEKKVVGAICIAPIILARAGILKGKRATVYYSMSKELEKLGAIYTGSEVEVEERIVTANGPDASWQFAEAIVNSLQ
jgi:protease I